MGPYRKIYRLMWKDEDFRNLSLEEKVIAIYIITAQSNSAGLFNFSPAQAAEDLEMSPETFGERFANVIRTLKWGWDNVARVVYIPSWWRYNAPPNPNVMKFNLADIDSLPATSLKEQFIANITHIPKSCVETFRQRFANVSATLAERIGDKEKEKEQEKEQEKEKDKESLNTKIPPPPHPTASGGGEKSPRRKRTPISSTPGIEAIYQAYPRKEARGKGIEAITKALAKIRIRPGIDDAELWLLDRTKLYASARARVIEQEPGAATYTPHPATWFNGDRFDDDAELWEPTNQNGKRGLNGQSAKPAAGEFSQPKRHIPIFTGSNGPERR